MPESENQTNITATFIIDSEHRDINLKPYSNLIDYEEHLAHGKCINVL
ncbi:hypothetical protein OGZ02_15150 [Brachyspira hyodysenteriae]|nr:hypothetical protein [Brachyspira hyodysenteriae]MDA1470128.1 hypothetical protein [Brachyspira hyodysenteriae]